MFKIIFYDYFDTKYESELIYSPLKAFDLSLEYLKLFKKVQIIEKRWNPVINKMMTYKYEVYKECIYFEVIRPSNIVYSRRKDYEFFLKLKEEMKDIIPLIKEIYEHHGFFYNTFNNEYVYALTLGQIRYIKDNIMKDPFIRSVYEEMIVLKNIVFDLQDFCDIQTDRLFNCKVHEIFKVLKEYKKIIQVE